MIHQHTCGDILGLCVFIWNTVLAVCDVEGAVGLSQKLSQFSILGTQTLYDIGLAAPRLGLRLCERATSLTERSREMRYDDDLLLLDEEDVQCLNHRHSGCELQISVLVGPWFYTPLRLSQK